MPGPLRSLAGRVVVVLALFGWPLSADADDIGARAGAFVEGLVDKAIASLTVEDISTDERRDRFRALLREHFAIATIGRWVLGRHWRRATEAERSEFLTLFEDLIVAIYADRFTEYSGERLSVTKTLVSDESRDALVFTRLARPEGGQAVTVAWRVREAQGMMRIIDVIVEGVSMSQTHRSEFGSVIRRNGGTVAGLIDELRRRLDGDA